MKNLVISIFLLIGLFAKAQLQELIENTWYLEYIVNENNSGGPVFPPESDEFDAITLSFITEGETTSFHTGVCADIEANVTSFSGNHIYFNNFICCGENSCTNPENADFEDEYVAFFMFEEFIFYNITENPDGSLSLFLGNSIFGEAHYRNQALSTSDINLNKNQFQIAFQNDDLIIKSAESIAKSVSIFDWNGKLILASEIKNGKVNAHKLPKGIYVVKIRDEKGNIYSKKVIKN